MSTSLSFKNKKIRLFKNGREDIEWASFVLKQKKNNKKKIKNCKNVCVHICTYSYVVVCI